MRILRMQDEDKDGNYLVRVRAQVMIRDDSSGGWVPMGGGGLSNVSVRKRALSLLPQQQPPPPPAPPPTAAPAAAHHHLHHSHHLHSAPAAPLDDHHSSNTAAAKHEYLIFGKRISDQSVVLSCTIKKDFEYNRVMPTFHHWRTGDKRFGLTFLTAADARAFDKGVRTAVDELLDGVAESSPLHKYNSEVGDDEVFMTLNLPVERGDSRSSSDSSSRGGAGCRPPPTPTGPPSETIPSPHPHHHHTHRIQYMSRHTPSTDGGTLSEVESQRRSCAPRDTEGKHGVISPGGGDGEPAENYSYVKLTPVHEYIYPVVVTDETKRAHRDSTSDRKAISPVGIDTMPAARPPLPAKLGRKRERHKGGGRGSGGGGGGRARCRHCNEAFSLGDNARGCCEYAPDPVRTGIDAVSCISCAQCMLYHCMADAEGDFARHPCDCGSGGGEGPGGGDGGGGAAGGDGCGRRWLGLALLSLLVPCLWCYPPLRACHKCGVACGLCGGRHEASPS